jgi:hypothetical protein
LLVTDAILFIDIAISFGLLLVEKNIKLHLCF